MNYKTNVLETLIARLRRCGQVRAVWRGGSAANGTSDRYSDIDLNILATDPADEVFAVVEDALRGISGIENLRGNATEVGELFHATAERVREHLGIQWQPELLGTSLRLRPLIEMDFESLFAAASDPLIWEVHPDRERYTRGKFEVYFRSAIESNGAIVIIDRATGKVIGSSRYINHDPTKSCVEIGYTFLTRDYWGGTYNRELKTLMMDYAFRFVEVIHFVVGKDNIRSRKAMMKLGGVELADPASVPRTRDISASVVYRITKSGWASRGDRTS